MFLYPDHPLSGLRERQTETISAEKQASEKSAIFAQSWNGRMKAGKQCHSV